MSRASCLRATLALLLVFVVASPSAASTPEWHWGSYGRHPLADTPTEAGARCQYDPVSRQLVAVRVRPPTVLAVDRTSGSDPQQVGARAWLERRSAPGGAWVKIASTPLMTGIATDSTSPFHTTMGILPGGSGEVRVIWVLSWYGTSGTLTGRAIHQLDHYLLRIGSVTMRRASGSCAIDEGRAASVMVSHGSRVSGRVALTFDMGGRLTPALDIATWLIEHEVPATIFPTGAAGSTSDDGRQVLGLVATHPDLFLLGNHSWDHPSFPALTADEMADQLLRTDTAIEAVAGAATRPLFRPPYGSCNGDVLRGVGAAGWALTVRWDVVTTDYLPSSQGGPTTEALVEQVLSNVQNGSIVIMHLGGYQTLDALPAIVDGLADQGLEPVTLATLLGL